MCLQPHWPSLHIAGPAQSPQVDKPYPASVPGTLQAISCLARKKIVHVVLNGSGVTDRNYWLGWRRKLVSCSQAHVGPWTDRFQPAWNVLMSITHIFSIIEIIVIIVTILRIVVCFPVLIQVCIRGTWIQWQSLQMLRTEAKTEHTKQYLVTQQMRHYWYPAAWSWPCQSPCDDCSERVWREMDCSKPVGHRVFGMTQHKTVIQSKMTLVFCWFLEFQCLEESSYLNNNMYISINSIIQKASKI